MAHIPGLYLKPESFSPSYGRKKMTDTLRLLAFLLPKKSPWLNPIEPLWLHAKRKIVEPGRKLAKAEIIQRVCAVFDNPVLSVFTTSENVS